MRSWSWRAPLFVGAAEGGILMDTEQQAPQAQPTASAPPPAGPVKQPTSGLAIAGLVLGCIAAVTSFLPIINNGSFFLAILGFILAFAGFLGKRGGKGIAIAGMVLGIVSVVIVLASPTLYGSMLDSFEDSLASGSTPEELAAPDEQADEQGEQSKGNDEGDSSAAAAETDYQNLAPGSTVKLKSGLRVTVNSITGGLANYDGSEIVCANVTYENTGDKKQSFNAFDWKAEDSSGVQRSMSYYSEASDELNSGDLSAGGTVTGNVYFDGPVAKVLYYGNMFDDTSAAAWVA